MITKKISLTGQEYNGDNALVLDGVAYDIGTRVIKWWETEGFNGYDESTARYVDPENNGVRVISGKRYDKRNLADIHQLVIHHSGGDRRTPKIMFDVLHNQRKLSVQFAIEDDGRIWQFLDAVECAWHAGGNNQMSIGVECCLMPDAKTQPDFYSKKNCKKTGNLPHEIKAEFLQGVYRPKLFQMPNPQVEAICRWAAGLWCAFGMSDPPVFPRDTVGKIPRKVIEDHLTFKGVLGHLHLTTKKWDPAGFPWEDAEKKIEEYFREFLQAKQAI